MSLVCRMVSNTRCNVTSVCILYLQEMVVYYNNILVTNGLVVSLLFAFCRVQSCDFGLTSSGYQRMSFHSAGEFLMFDLVSNMLWHVEFYFFLWLCEIVDVLRLRSSLLYIFFNLFKFSCQSLFIVAGFCYSFNTQFALCRGSTNFERKMCSMYRIVLSALDQNQYILDVSLIFIKMEVFCDVKSIIY